MALEVFGTPDSTIGTQPWWYVSLVRSIWRFAGWYGKFWVHTRELLVFTRGVGMFTGGGGDRTGL